MPGQSTTPAWSPDGGRIAFVRHLSDERQIFTVRLDGRDRRRLSLLPGRASAPAWSPQGRWIVFVLSDGGSQIALVREDGRAQRLLTRLPGERRTPAWSSDGQWIAFLSREGTEPFSLYVVRPDGTGLRRVPTRAPGLQPDVTSFVWVPDGRLAYTSRSGPAQEAVTMTTRDGTDQVYLGTASAPAWAPDGRRYAFVVSRVGGAQIYVRDRIGAPLVRLTDPRVISVRPAWSPDGRRIAFLIIDRGLVSLAVMNADGSDQRRLTILYGDLSTSPVFAWRPR